jgi:hypothetical protein
MDASRGRTLLRVAAPLGVIVVGLGFLTGNAMAAAVLKLVTLTVPPDKLRKA